MNRRLKKEFEKRRTNREKKKSAAKTSLVRKPVRSPKFMNFAGSPTDARKMTDSNLEVLNMDDTDTSDEIPVEGLQSINIDSGDTATKEVGKPVTVVSIKLENVDNNCPAPCEPGASTSKKLENENDQKKEMIMDNSEKSPVITCRKLADLLDQSMGSGIEIEIVQIPAPQLTDQSNESGPGNSSKILPKTKSNQSRYMDMMRRQKEGHSSKLPIKSADNQSPYVKSKVHTMKNKSAGTPSPKGKRDHSSKSELRSKIPNYKHKTHGSSSSPKKSPLKKGQHSHDSKKDTLLNKCKGNYKTAPQKCEPTVPQKCGRSMPLLDDIIDVTPETPVLEETPSRPANDRNNKVARTLYNEDETLSTNVTAGTSSAEDKPKTGKRYSTQRTVPPLVPIPSAPAEKQPTTTVDLNGQQSPHSNEQTVENNPTGSLPVEPNYAMWHTPYQGYYPPVPGMHPCMPKITGFYFMQPVQTHHFSHYPGVGQLGYALPPQGFQPLVPQQANQSRASRQGHQPRVPEQAHLSRVSQQGHQPQVPEQAHLSRDLQQGHQPRVAEQAHQPRVPEQDHQPRVPQQGNQPRVPEQARQPRVPQEGHQPRVPEQARQPRVPQQDYQPRVHEQGRQLRIPQQGYQPQLSQHGFQHQMVLQARPYRIQQNGFQHQIPQNGFHQHGIQQQLARHGFQHPMPQNGFRHLMPTHFSFNLVQRMPFRPSTPRRRDVGPTSQPQVDPESRNDNNSQS